jgi:hypothetical protein
MLKSAFVLNNCLIHWCLESFDHFPFLFRSSCESKKNMASSPQPVNAGTGLYILAAFAVIIWAWALQRGGYLSKDSFQ